MIPMQITYTEYQRAEQPIADFITHLLLVIKKIASPFVWEYRQWGKDRLSSSGQEFIVPLSTTHMLEIFVMDVDYGCDRFGAETTAGNKFMVWNKGDSGAFIETNFRWFAICS